MDKQFGSVVSSKNSDSPEVEIVINEVDDIEMIASCVPSSGHLQQEPPRGLPQAASRGDLPLSSSAPSRSSMTFASQPRCPFRLDFSGSNRSSHLAINSLEHCQPQRPCQDHLLPNSAAPSGIASSKPQPHEVSSSTMSALNLLFEIPEHLRTSLLAQRKIMTKKQHLWRRPQYKVQWRANGPVRTSRFLVNHRRAGGRKPVVERQEELRSPPAAGSNFAAENLEMPEPYREVQLEDASTATSRQDLALASPSSAGDLKNARDSCPSVQSSEGEQNRVQELHISSLPYCTSNFMTKQKITPGYQQQSPAKTTDQFLPQMNQNPPFSAIGLDEARSSLQELDSLGGNPSSSRGQVGIGEKDLSNTVSEKQVSLVEESFEEDFSISIGQSSDDNPEIIEVKEAEQKKARNQGNKLINLI